MVRAQPDPPHLYGGLAQLGEHLLCKQGVVGSIPSSSTIHSLMPHYRTPKLSASAWVFDRRIGWCSLTIRRVKSELPVGGAVGVSVGSSLMQVESGEEAETTTQHPPCRQLIDSVNRLQFARFEARHSAKYSKCSLTMPSQRGVKIIGSSE